MKLPYDANYVIMLITHMFVCSKLSAKSKRHVFIEAILLITHARLFLKMDFLSIKRQDKAATLEFCIVLPHPYACPVLLHIEGIRCSPDTTGSREEVTPNLLFAFYQCHVSPRDLWISQLVGVIINQRNPFLYVRPDRTTPLFGH